MSLKWLPALCTSISIEDTCRLRPSVWCEPSRPARLRGHKSATITLKFKTDMAIHLAIKGTLKIIESYLTED